MKTVFQKTRTMTDTPTHYCPGCHHGLVHRLVAECIDELGVRERTVGVAPVGCAVLAYNYLDLDMMEAPHGRAPAVATGLRRALPDRIVFTYQGDGDLAAIGTGEIIHAAARGENITVVFINNANYGMTGGQMAPTTLVGQKTTTTPRGRNPKNEGYPLKVAEIMAVIDGVAFSQRTAVFNPKLVRETKAAIKKAFTNQIEGKGFSIVEVLSACPTNWGMSPVEANRWVEETMMPVFPLGVFKDAPQGGQTTPTGKAV
jgi:2-oxoglutarate ferredoxin oxidoreductase subunit beta